MCLIAEAVQPPASVHAKSHGQIKRRFTSDGNGLELLEFLEALANEGEEVGTNSSEICYPEEDEEQVQAVAEAKIQLELKEKEESDEETGSSTAASSLVYQPEGHPKQAEIDGEVWPPTFEAVNVRAAKGMDLCASDTFVCTYPKCGTTWIQHICSQLLFADGYGPSEGRELFLTSPMVERMGAAFCARLAHPRLLKTHFSWANCPKSASARYIFAARNPKDCLVSYFHHHRNFRCYQWAEGDFDLFFELFMAGQLGFGDYFDHLLGWLPHLHDRNVLFLKYEDMLDDLAGAVHRIGLFLGGTAAERVEQAEQLARVVASSRIEAMRASQEHFFPTNALHKATFIRKGGTRDWKNRLSREQSRRLDQLFEQKMAGTEAEGWWHREMMWEDEEGKGLDEAEMKPEGEGRGMDEMEEVEGRIMARERVGFARPMGY